MSRTPLFIIAGLAAALTAGGAAWWLNRPAADRFAQCSTSSVAGAYIGGPFTLVSETGETVTDAEGFCRKLL